MNLKHLKRPGRAQLAAVQDACEDDGVRGGERIDLQERCDSLQKKFGACVRGTRVCDRPGSGTGDALLLPSSNFQCQCVFLLYVGLQERCAINVYHPQTSFARGVV